MTAKDDTHFTHCGLPGIDLIPRGLHACHFYSDHDELVAALVPYFLAGLRANERCIWVASPQLSAREAIQELRAMWDGVDDAIQTDALRILDFDQWYMSSAALREADVVKLWLEEEKRALADGYDGLRISGNTSFLKPDDWASFIEYEQVVCAHFNGRHIVALCSYMLTQCDDKQVNEVMQAHHCTFVRPDVDWEVTAVLPFSRTIKRVVDGEGT